MAKILYTDLFGTLIGDRNEIINEAYANKDEELENVFKLLELFISDGNYLNIVTSPQTHGQINEKFINLIIKIYNSFSEENKKRLRFYFQAKAKVTHHPSIHLKEINGEYIYVINDTIEARHVNKKEDAIISSELPNSNNIYTIGDSSNDIGMLLKTESIGGNSAFINILPCDQYSYSHECSTLNDFLYLKYAIEFSIKEEMLEKEYLNSSYELDSAYYNDERVKILNQQKSERFDELKEAYNNGELDLEKIKYDYTKYKLYNNYICNDLFEEKRIKDEHELKKVISMNHFRNFNEYYNRILK